MSTTLAPPPPDRVTTRPTWQRVVDGRYEIEREVGHGGMGVVYLANDLQLNRKVAIKMIAELYSEDVGLVRRFEREAEKLAAVRHENVVQVFAFCAQKPPAFVMEYVNGASLADIIWDHLKLRATIPIRRVLTIVRQIASAVDAVHAAGLLHRDVKPDNIVIEERSGRPVLIDFGLVAPISEQVTVPAGYGTPQYMAPEMCPDSTATPARVGTAMDLYSLACTAFELLTGRPVFDSPSRWVVFSQQRTERAPTPSVFRPELAPFDAIFARALEKNPAKRFASGAEFAAALDRAGAQWVHAAEMNPTGRVHRSAGAVNVLVVDDDESFRRFAMRAAQLAFYRRDVEVRVASSGRDAIASALAWPPQVVLLDYAMPGLDGIETLAELREVPSCSGARVVVVSANAREQERARFAVLGVSDFIEKPVALKRLVELIGSFARARGVAA